MSKGSCRSHLIPISGGRQASETLEDDTEVLRVLEAASLGDFGKFLVGLQEQTACMVELLITQHVLGTMSEESAKAALKRTPRKVRLPTEILDAKSLGSPFADQLHCDGELSIPERVDAARFSQNHLSREYTLVVIARSCAMHQIEKHTSGDPADVFEIERDAAQREGGRACRVGGCC